MHSTNNDSSWTSIDDYLSPRSSICNTPNEIDISSGHVPILHPILNDTEQPCSSTNSYSILAQDKDANLSQCQAPKTNVKKNKNKELYTWSQDVPNIPSFEFKEEVGLKIDTPGNADPIYFVKLLITDELISEIMERTNAYAEQVINSSRPLRRKSVLNLWKPISDDETRKFLGLV